MDCTVMMPLWLGKTDRDITNTHSDHNNCLWMWFAAAGCGPVHFTASRASVPRYKMHAYIQVYLLFMWHLWSYVRPETQLVIYGNLSFFQRAWSETINTSSLRYSGTQCLDLCLCPSRTSTVETTPNVSPCGYVKFDGENSPKTHFA